MFWDDDDDDDVCSVIQADDSQENLVVSRTKKLDPDGLVKFINTNEVRYITEYNQVVSSASFHLDLKKKKLQMKANMF